MSYWDPDDRRRRAGVTLALWLLITAAIWAAVVGSCLLGSGCGSAVPTAAHPLPVVIVQAIPGARRPSCVGLWDIPKAPEMPPIPGSDDVPDVVDRIFVHARTYAEMIDFAHDLHTWAEIIRDCLQKLTDP